MGRSIKRVIRTALRLLSLRIVVWRARPAPAIPVDSALLVVAPHPDDETLGCGAMLARLRDAGNRVVVAVATDGQSAPRGRSAEVGQRRRNEALNACKRLGIGSKDLVFLGLEDGDLEAEDEVLRDAIESLIIKVGADAIFVTAATDRHPDHQAAAKVARDLAHQHTLDLWEYPIWMWKNWPLMGSSTSPWKDALKRTFTLRLACVPTGQYLDDKRAALSEYRSQLSTRYGGEGADGLPEELIEFLLRPYELFIVESANGPNGRLSR